MEQKIEIKTPDNHIIYGTLNQLPNNNDTLIIFVHGLSGNQHEHHYFNAVPFFNEKGFSVFRFDFYARELKARQLSKSTITTHAEDLESVIKHFKDNYKNIVLVGHSLGTLAILKANLSDISKIVLWDPTVNFNDIKGRNNSFNTDLNQYIFHWGMDILINNQMIEEWKKIDLTELIDKINVPCKFVFAGDRKKYVLWEPFLKKINIKNEIAIIEWATHCFYEEWTEQKLFKETLDWLK